MPNNDEYIGVKAQSVGYVTSIKSVETNGITTMKIKMNLLSGKKTRMNYIPASLDIYGEQAKGIASALEDRVVEAGGKYNKVLMSFLGAITPSYRLSEGNSGEIIPIFEGSITYVNSIKEDGKVTYSDKFWRDASKEYNA